MNEDEHFTPEEETALRDLAKSLMAMGAIQKKATTFILWGTSLIIGVFTVIYLFQQIVWRK